MIACTPWTQDVSFPVLEAVVRGVLKEKYSENMHQIYKRTHTPKCNFSKVAKQLY